MPTAASPEDGGLGPLTPDEVRLIEGAGERARQATRAAQLATLNGWSFVAAALLCLPLAFADPLVLLVGLCLVGVAVVELRGASALRAFEVAATRRLALNQVALFVVIFVYCVVRLWGALTGPSPTEQLLSEYPEVTDLLGATGDLSAIEPMLEQVDRVYLLAVVGLYVGVIVVSGFYQGLCAFYYWTRAPHLEAYLEQTPGWVRELQLRMRG